MRSIVILSTFLSPFRSGAEACVEEVPLALADRYDFTIITARLRRNLPVRDTLQGKIPVIRVGLGCGFDKWLYPFLAPFVARRLKPDLVHGILESFAGMALVLCRWIVPKAKRIQTLQTTNTKLLKSLIITSADRVTAISKVLVDTANTLRSDKTIHISNGIPLNAINKARGDTQKQPNRIVFVGRLEPMKGIDTLLRAFAKVDERAELVIVGGGSQEQKLRNLAQELGIQERVHMKGFVAVPEVYREFAAAQIFCGLSRSEALGNVFLEAQAAGCAVVGTTVGGIPDIVQHGKTGLLVPPDNVDMATSALTDLLTNDSLRELLQRNGVNNAKVYDWSVIGEKYAGVYAALT